MKRVLGIAAAGLVLLTGCVSPAEYTGTSTPTVQPTVILADLTVTKVSVDGSPLTCVGFSGGMSCNWEAWNSARKPK